MKIAIVSGTYREGMGYQENIWADELRRRGQEVLVLMPERPDELLIAQAPEGSAGLCPLPTWRLPRGILLCRHVGHALSRFRPEVVLWFGPGQYFGLDILRARSLKGTPVVTFFSENPGMHEFDWRKGGISLKERLHAIGYFLLRGGVSRLACDRSDLIIANCPETIEILGLLYSDEEKRRRAQGKMLHLPLGFNPQIYGYSPEMGARTRRELGLEEEDIVVCVSSRFSEGKRRPETVVSSLKGVLAALGRDDRLRAVIVGFEDNVLSAQLREIIAPSPAAARTLTLPFASQTRLNELYNASDMAVFGNATISCQAALGTGAVVCIADEGAMTHLLRLPEQGRIFRQGDADDVADKILGLSAELGAFSSGERKDLRLRLSQGARWLGYDLIIEKALQTLREISSKR